MKTSPIVPARLEHDADGIPRSPDIGDIYHPRHGALAQARHVFLAGNELPARWRARERFVILETGFGLGNNFLATWAAWRVDAARCTRLHFISIEARPLLRDELASLAREAELAPLARQLASAWPCLTCNLHCLSFEAGQVQLLLAFGDVAAWLPQIAATVDAFFLDGFTPARNPDMWEPRLFKAMGRMAAANATAATWSAARSVRDGLRAAGFEVRSGPGTGGKRDITLARFAPSFTPRPRPRQRAGSTTSSCPGSDDERIVIIGGGLAGCAAAWALAEQGRTSLLLERHAELAIEGSGNAAGLFHGVVHADDGRHARFNRAAALEARNAVAAAIADHGVLGRTDGLLRLEPLAKNVAGLRATIAELGLPADYVEALDANAASAIAGLAINVPAWYYPHGGWVDPRGLARSFMARAGEFTAVRFGADVAALRRIDDRWILLDAAGLVLETATTVVLANAGGAIALPGAPWPVVPTRGQISAIEETRWPKAHTPRVPIAGTGYVLPPSAGKVWFGATSQAGDTDPAVRAQDNRDNLERLSKLLPGLPRFDIDAIEGRTALRWVSDDRLPIIGAVPFADISLGMAATGMASARPEQPRFAPRAPGLFAFTALGSRGIAWSALGAQVLASAITGAPSPVEADLLDAIDPARFASRAFRRATHSDRRSESVALGAPQGG